MNLPTIYNNSLANSKLPDFRFSSIIDNNSYVLYYFIASLMKHREKISVQKYFK